MFGYLKINTQYCNKELQNAYKNYYCGLCFALEKYYGVRARFLVNYDVTLLAIVLCSHKSPGIKRLNCLGQKRLKNELFCEDVWEKLAAITILLASEKMHDDINDEHSISAFIGKILFQKQIKKAKNNNPELCSIISNGYKKITIDEKNNENVMTIGNKFAEMMCQIIKSVDKSYENALTYVRFISNWLYYIDALDDYDEDIKSNRFNPLVINRNSFKQYVNEHFSDIKYDLKNLFSDFPTLKNNLSEVSVENKLMLTVICDTIPTITYNILKSA